MAKLTAQPSFFMDLETDDVTESYPLDGTRLEFLGGDTVERFPAVTLTLKRTTDRRLLGVGLELGGLDARALEAVAYATQQPVDADAIPAGTHADVTLHLKDDVLKDQLARRYASTKDFDAFLNAAGDDGQPLIRNLANYQAA